MDIRLGGYNIRNGRNGGIKSAMHAMAQANMDLGVLFEKNITGSVYTCHSLYYNVLASEDPRKHQGGGSDLIM